MEAKFFGWRTALIRNGLSFLGAILIARLPLGYGALEAEGNR